MAIITVHEPIHRTSYIYIVLYIKLIYIALYLARSLLYMY